MGRMICSTTTPPVRRARSHPVSRSRRRSGGRAVATPRIAAVDVEGRGQAKAVIDERLLAAPIAVIHGPQLRDRLVRLIHEHEKVAGEIIHQVGGGWPGRRPVRCLE